MYFLKCILLDTPNVTYAMQECMGKIEFMAKMSTPHTYFLTIQTLQQWPRRYESYGEKSLQRFGYVRVVGFT